MALNTVPTGPSATPPEKEAWDAAKPEQKELAAELGSLLNAADKDLKFALLSPIKKIDAVERKKLEGWIVRLRTHTGLMELRSKVTPANTDIASQIKKARRDIEEHFAMQSEIMGIVLGRLAKESEEEKGKKLARFIAPEEEEVADRKTPFRFGAPTLRSKNKFEKKPIADRLDQVEGWIAEFSGGTGELVRKKSSALPDFADIDYAHKTIAEAYAKIDPKSSHEEKEARVIQLKRMELSLRAIERNDVVGLARKFSSMNSLGFAMAHTKGGTMKLLQENGFLDRRGNPRSDVIARNMARYGKSFDVVRNGGRMAGIGVVGTLFLISAMAVGKKMSSKQILRPHDYLLTLGYGGGALLLSGGIPKSRKMSPEEKEAEKLKKEAAKDATAMRPDEEKNLTMIAHAATLPLNESFTDALDPMGGKENAGVAIAQTMHNALESHPEKKVRLQESLAHSNDIDRDLLKEILGEKSPAYFAMTKERVLPEHRKIVVEKMLENHIERNENLLAVVAALEYHA